MSISLDTLSLLREHYGDLAEEKLLINEIEIYLSCSHFIVHLCLFHILQYVFDSDDSFPSYASTVQHICIYLMSGALSV